MIQGNDVGRTPIQHAIDNALMLLVASRKNETKRENRRGKVSYPPSSDGTTQFGGLPKLGKSKPMSPLEKLMAKAKGQFRPVPPLISNKGVGDFTDGSLDTSQVADRRSALQAMLQGASNPMAGDGRQERPAPAFGLNLAPDGYPGQTAPAGQTGGDPQDVMMQILKQYMAGRRSAPLR